MKYIDMHTHTTASDGTLTPTQLIQYAIVKGLAGIAITDHDTIAGIKEAKVCCSQLSDFTIIPGVELSTEDSGEEVHILGYNINYKSKELLDTLMLIQNQRMNRVKKMVKKLQGLDIDITYNEILAMSKQGVIGRPHVARALVKKGYIEDLQEAFVKYLSKGCPAYVPRYKLTPFEAIDLIHKVGGIAVVAHPGLIKNHGILLNILRKGVDGIEVYHPEHKKQDNIKYLALANEYQLIVTAGSDFHSPPIEDKGHGDLGTEKMPLKDISKIFKVL
ncbi:hypothetical protein SAMN05660297_00256 [Natronincola peptidivorans]|uniref:Polymerase/histidinol phosphatase N-terminal domain-containing protein n=1 Tax=Natronincola peptidivorans TaxID=426128 RepID=A0A1H9YIU2_9FIRM|nr:PHP domain-containing protein [Natronincola peptidivorans]SES68983.1 hypothetical protein SAMN05660297_00256 [Natronincola peptidivorans]